MSKGKKRLQMQRETDLQIENAQLKKQVRILSQVHDQHVEYIQTLKQTLEGNEQLTIVYDPKAIDLSSKVDVSTANKALAELKAADDADFNLMWALLDLRRVVDRVDAIATAATLTDLPTKLEGYDETLAALYTRVIGAADAAGLLDEIQQIIGGNITSRIAAIRMIKRDGGESLHRVIAEISLDFRKEAEALFSKDRQGRQVEPRTKRCYEHALKFKVDAEIKRTWEQAGHACYDWLVMQGIKLDKTDRDLRDEMTNLSNADRGNILSTCYHNYRRTL